MARPEHAVKIDSSVLGMPSGPWPLVRQGAQGPETYQIPTQTDAVGRLPEPERTTLLNTIREHEANLAFLRQTSARFFDKANTGKLHAIPEYAQDLGEALMSVDLDNLQNENPLHPHEPVLQALPSYSRIVLLTPEAGLAKVKARLHALGLGNRVRLVVSQNSARPLPNEGVTRWVRDILLMARTGEQGLLLASLAHMNHEQVFENDLAYLSRISTPEHPVLRLPIFLRGGNLAIARAGRTLLFIGSDELAMNQRWFADTFAFSLAPDAVQRILQAATGADEVVVLPNSRNFFHLDTFIAPLRDGVVGLLSPLDPGRLHPVDRNVLDRARGTLLRLGFQVVPIPTTVDRIRNFQSAANIVPFTDRRTGRRQALVPMFPEPEAPDLAHGLNARVLDAYRRAGIEPIPVEDRFHPRWGNTHCALVPLH